jgi:serine phosphatase RsbU (regulator of sigma subunit)
MSARRTAERDGERLRRYASAVGIVALLIAIALLDRTTNLFHLTMLYVVPVVIATYVFGLAGGLLTGALALAEVIGAHSLRHSATLLADVTTDFVMFLFVAIVIDRLRLQLQTIRALEARRDYDLGIARDVQRRKLTPPPADDRFDVASALHFVREVGGDYYRFEEANGKLFLFAGDISGKGMSAALFAALLDEAIGDALQVFDGLEALVQSVNRRMHATMPVEMFVTMFFAILDDDEASFVNAGHVRPLLFEAAAGRTVELSDPGTLPLGIEPSLHPIPARLPIVSGDVLLICSDGVTESPALLHQPGLLESTFEGVARQEPQAVVDAVTALAESAGQTDDVTVICVKRR